MKNAKPALRPSQILEGQILEGQLLDWQKWMEKYGKTIAKQARKKTCTLL